MWTRKFGSFRILSILHMAKTALLLQLEDLVWASQLKTSSKKSTTLFLVSSSESRVTSNWKRWLCKFFRMISLIFLRWSEPGPSASLFSCVHLRPGRSIKVILMTWFHQISKSKGWKSNSFRSSSSEFVFQTAWKTWLGLISCPSNLHLGISSLGLWCKVILNGRRVAVPFLVIFTGKPTKRCNKADFASALVSNKPSQTRKGVFFPALVVAVVHVLELVKATFLVQVEMPSGLGQAAWKRWPQVEPLELRDSHSQSTHPIKLLPKQPHILTKSRHNSRAHSSNLFRYVALSGCEL